jgi:hypothetical protein
MKKLLGRLATIGALSVALAAPLSALTITDSLGFYTPPEPASPTDEVTRINVLIDQAPNSSNTISGILYDRTAVSSAGLPDANLTGAVKDDTSPSTTVDVTGFEYLLGKYNGPNGGAVVWYVGNLSGNQTIPANQAFTTGGTAFGLSHWSLYNANGGGTTGVPDGGNAVALLGLALAAMALIRRRLG